MLTDRTLDGRIIAFRLSEMNDDVGPRRRLFYKKSGAPYRLALVTLLMTLVYIFFY